MPSLALAPTEQQLSFFAAFFGDEERAAAFFAAVTLVAGVGVGVGAVVGVGSGAAGGTVARLDCHQYDLSVLRLYFSSKSVVIQF